MTTIPITARDIFFNLFLSSRAVGRWVRGRSRGQGGHHEGLSVVHASRTRDHEGTSRGLFLPRCMRKRTWGGRPPCDITRAGGDITRRGGRDHERSEEHHEGSEGGQHEGREGHHEGTVDITRMRNKLCTRSVIRWHSLKQEIIVITLLCMIVYTIETAVRNRVRRNPTAQPRLAGVNRHREMGGLGLVVGMPLDTLAGPSFHQQWLPAAWRLPRAVRRSRPAPLAPSA